MTPRHLFHSIYALLLACPSCTGSGAAGSTVADTEKDGAPPAVLVAADSGDEDVPPPVTAPAPGQWASIVAQSWQLEPGTEGYWCKRVTVAEDFWVRGLRAVAPTGTHHTTLGKDSGGPDGSFRCGGFSTGSELLFSSGVGTDSAELPDGVAIKVTVGEQLLLNLHVNNVSEDVLTGTSAIEVMALDPAAVVHEAGFVLAGVTGGLAVVPGESTQTGRCTMPVDVTVLSVWPHMHTWGVHQLVKAGGTNAPLFDGPYAFAEQRSYWLAPPTVVPANGQVEVTCTYRNDTTHTLIFGESTDNEMCFAGLYHYPRFTRGSTCQQ